MKAPLIVLLVALAGCAGTDGTQSSHATGDELLDMEAFWGDTERQTVMDETIDTTAISGGNSPTFRIFQPTGGIVPPGTETVVVTISQVETFRNHDHAKLAYQSAADSDWREVADFAMGRPAAIDVKAGDADPPGQGISSWAFRIFYPPDMTAFGVGSLSQAHIEIVALRGEVLPEFSPQSAWNLQPLHLFSGGGTVSGAYNGEDCYGVTGCPATVRPVAPIPQEARIVEVTVDHTAGFQPLLRFHTGESWTWIEADATLSAPTQTIFRVAVDEPDSPYATKSAWGFSLRNDAPTSLDPTAGQFEWRAYALA